MKPLYAALVFSAFFAACKSAQKSGATDTESTLKLDKPLNTDKSLLWQISGNGLTKPSYLFGTIHLIDEARYTLGKNVERKLSKADEVVMEVDLNNINVLTLAQLSLLPEGETVKQYMSDSDYTVLQQFMADSIGIDKYAFENGYAKFKPFFIEQLFYVRHMGQRNESYEINLKKIAESKSIPMSGLETYEEQLQLFEDIPLEVQLKDLVASIKDYSGEIDQLESLIELYTRQDLPGLAKAFEEEEDKQLMDKLLKLRNTGWLPKIEQIIKSKSAFFAVGAGHLGGEFGIIQLLKKQGYTVEPISTN
jgi:uncharacterized protein